MGRNGLGMRSLFFLFPLLLVLLSSVVKADQLKVSLSKHEGKEAGFDVVFSNSGNGEVSFICPMIAYGVGTMVLIFSDDGGAKVFVYPRAQDVTGGPPLRTVKLGAGETKKYSINLNDGWWEIPLVIGGEGMRNVSLEYNIPKGTFDELTGSSVIRSGSEQLTIDHGPVFEGALKTERVSLPGSLKSMIRGRR